MDLFVNGSFISTILSLFEHGCSFFFSVNWVIIWFVFLVLVANFNCFLDVVDYLGYSPRFGGLLSFSFPWF